MRNWIIGTFITLCLIAGLAYSQVNMIVGCIPFMKSDGKQYCDNNLRWDDTNDQIVLGDNTNIRAMSASSEVLTTTQSLDVTDCGRAFFIATDAIVITLPATIAGCKMSFTNTGADGNNIITISPAAADYIAGTITLAASVVDLGVVDDKDLINTKATSITGDSVTIIGNGTTGWFVLSSTGIWASE